MGRNCFKAVLYGLKGYLRRSRSVCTASYMCVRRHSREHGNRVEAVLPPSDPACPRPLQGGKLHRPGCVTNRVEAATPPSALRPGRVIKNAPASLPARAAR